MSQKKSSTAQIGGICLEQDISETRGKEEGVSAIAGKSVSK